MPKGTIRLHRVLRANPERVYRAFLDADAMAKWLPPYGFTCKVHHLDAKVGGTYKMSFTNFATGHSHSLSLKQVSCGTELHIVQEGVPEAIPPEGSYLGWQESLTLLAQLVEAEIPE